MRTHYTLKHVADSASPAKRPRTDRGAEDAGGAYADGGEHEDGGLGYDYDLTGDVDAEHDRSWRVPEDANDIPLEAELNTQLQLYNSSFSINCQPRPSWVPMNETAAALAQLEYLPSRDLVGERLLSFEEFDLWATSYNISMAAQENLQRRLRAVNENGDPLFVLMNLQKSVSAQRAVIDAAVPEYLRSVGGPLLTDASLEAGKLKQVDMEGRNMQCVLIELLKQYEPDVDFELAPVLENGLRLYDGRIASGDRAQTLKRECERLHPGGYTILVQLHSDKTLYGSRESLWPMYVTLLNIHPELRSMQETRRLVAFFPILRGAYVTGNNRRRGQAIWQQILSWLLQPLVDQLHVS
jgi:hypothetical protein